MTTGNTSPSIPTLRLDCREVKSTGDSFVNILNDFDPATEPQELAHMYDSARITLGGQKNIDCRVDIVRYPCGFALECTNTVNCGIFSETDADFRPHA